MSVGTPKKNEFTRFWNAYPRLRNQQRSEELFNLAVSDGVDPLWIVRSAEKYRAENAGNSRQYIAYADNWLTEKRWEDFPKDQPGRSKENCEFEDRALFWAKMIKAKKYVAPSAFSAQLAQHMFQAELVTQAELREIGVHL